MKKIRILALLTMCLMLFSACGTIVDVTKMATIGDEGMLKSEFNYYLMVNKSAVSQEAQRAGVTLTEEKDWKNTNAEGVTYAQQVIDKTVSDVRKVMVWEAKAKEAGITLTAEELAEIDSNRSQIIESVGGRYQYEEFFAAEGVDPADLEGIITREKYATKFQQQYKEENAADFEVSEDVVNETYEKDYITVKHILIMNTPQTTDEVTNPTPVADAEQYDKEAKAKAEDILKQIKDGADFDKLMNEYSEDGRDESGNLGNSMYTFKQDGSMDPAFEEASFKLAKGDVSELVQSSYGYHIITRIENPVDSQDAASIKDTIKSEEETKILDTLTEKWAQELGFKENTKAVSNIKIK